MPTSPTLGLDPLAILEQLSLARSREAFARSLEEMAVECLGGGKARFFRFRSWTGLLLRPWEKQKGFPLGEETLPGRVGLHMEYTVDRKMLPVPGLDGSGPINVGLPILLYGALIGVLTVVGLVEEPDRERAAALGELVRVGGVAWEFTCRQEDAAAYAQRVEDVLVSATESLTPKGRGHTMRVARLATELATLMDLSTQSRNLVWRASLYHDVGKLVLAGQQEVERLHPTAGAEFLRSGRVLRELAPLVAASHERYDGTGFPRGLKGDQAPIEAWVLAMAEHLAESPEAWADVESWVDEVEDSHHPAVADAMNGIVAGGRIREILG